MKKVSYILLIVVMILSVVSNVQADEKTVQGQNTIYLENGDYILVELMEGMSRSIYSQSGSKSYTCYDSDGVAKWQAVLKATFIYTGSSSTCTDASCDITIYDSSCYLISKNASRSGNTAYGTVTVGRKILGITHDQNTINLTLTCDVNGNLS